MEWYSAKIIYEITNSLNDIVQVDEQLRIIQAVSKELAYEIANQLGYIHQDKVCTNTGAVLSWNFIAVTEIKHIGEIRHGSEVSSVIQDSPKESFLEEIRQKANYLKSLISPSLEGVI